MASSILFYVIFSNSSTYVHVAIIHSVSFLFLLFPLCGSAVYRLNRLNEYCTVIWYITGKCVISWIVVNSLSCSTLTLVLP